MDYKISEKYLNKLLSDSARNLVGKTCKRFEILQDKEDIKKSIKELIYENYRELKALIISFNVGVEFKTRPNKQD